MSKLDTASAKTKPAKRGRSWPWVVGAIALILVLAIVARMKGQSPSPSASNERSRSSSGPCEQASARAVVSRAEAEGIIRGMDADAQEGVVIMVEPRQWRAGGLPVQKILAAQIDCAVAGPGGHLREMHFRIDRSGADLYTLSATDLLHLRQQGIGGPSPK